MKKTIALALGITAVVGTAITMALICKGSKCSEDKLPVPDDDYEPDDEDYWNTVLEDELEEQKRTVTKEDAQKAETSDKSDEFCLSEDNKDSSDAVTENKKTFKKKKEKKNETV